MFSRAFGGSFSAERTPTIARERERQINQSDFARPPKKSPRAERARLGRPMGFTNWPSEENRTRKEKEKEVSIFILIFLIMVSLFPLFEKNKRKTETELATLVVIKTNTQTWETSMIRRQ